MDSKHKVIKAAVEKHYAAIKYAEDHIQALREECDHVETKLVNYMWAPGHINPGTKVCSICGDLIDDLLQENYIQDEDQSI